MKKIAEAVATIIMAPFVVLVLTFLFLTLWLFNWPKKAWWERFFNWMNS